VLGDDHHPRRAAIQPVHDSRTQLTAHPTEVLDVMHQRIHERPARMSRRWMHHHPSRFVHDDQVAVFVQDRKGKLFGRDSARGLFGDVEHHAIAGSHHRVRPRDRRTDVHAFLANEPLDLRPRELCQHGGKVFVETLARLIRGDLDLEKCHRPSGHASDLAACVLGRQLRAPGQHEQHHQAQGHHDQRNEL
jgi:hypothetical protein